MSSMPSEAIWLELHCQTQILSQEKHLQNTFERNFILWQWKHDSKCSFQFSWCSWRWIWWHCIQSKNDRVTSLPNDKKTFALKWIPGKRAALNEIEAYHLLKDTKEAVHCYGFAIGKFSLSNLFPHIQNAQQIAKDIRFKFDYSNYDRENLAAARLV